MTENWLIISRYNEDISWIKYIIKNKLINKILIFNKGKNNLPLFQTNKVKIIKRNNIGREGETYLSFIIDNYYKLPDNIWFSQGDPFEHSPDFLYLLSPEIIKEYINKEIQSLTIRWKSEANIPPNYFLRNNNFYNIKNYRTIDYFIDSNNLQVIGHSSFYDEGVKWTHQQFKNYYKSENVMVSLSEKLDIKPPKKLIKCIWSACFFVKKQNILRHPINVYLKLKKFLLETDSQGGFQGYVLERFWPYLFTGKSYSSITECYQKDFLQNEGIISFNNTNKKKTKKYFDKKSYIIQDIYNILLIKKNGKILCIPGLNIINNDIQSDCDKKINNLKLNYGTKKIEKKLAVILTGNIRDSFQNQNLNIFIKHLYKYFNIVNIYIRVFENKQIFNGYKWVFTEQKNNTETIKEYFDMEIKNINLFENYNKNDLIKFSLLRNDILENLTDYQKIIDFRIDFFGENYKSINNFKLSDILDIIENSNQNIYIKNNKNLNIDDFIISNSSIYKKMMINLFEKKKFILKKCKNKLEVKNYINNLIEKL